LSANSVPILFFRSYVRIQNCQWDHRPRSARAPQSYWKRCSCVSEGKKHLINTNLKGGGYPF